MAEPADNWKRMAVQSSSGNEAILKELNEVYTLTKAELENEWLK